MDLLERKLMGFHQIGMEKLQNILCCIPGRKDLIIEPSLIKPLELVCGAAWLRSKGIDKIYKFDLNQLNIPTQGQHLVYFIRSSSETLKKVLGQVQSLRNKNASSYTDTTPYFHVIIMPDVEHKLQKLLEEEGLYGIVELYRFHWDFLTLDSNLLSLELPEVFKEVFVDKDFSVLPSIAKSLRIFDMISRKPNIVLTYGSRSEKLWQMVEHMEQARPSRNDENPNSSDFCVLLLMDRNKDYPSCFMTPVTYAGLLAELYSVSAGCLLTSEENRIQKGKLSWLEGQAGGGETPKAPSIKTESGAHLKMNSVVDKTFCDNKYRHFSDVLTVLSVQAKALGLEGQEYSKDMKIHEMKQFVEKKLPKVAAAKRELVKHLSLCEVIVNEYGKHFEMIQRVEENMAFNQHRKQTLHEIEEQFLTLHMNRFVALKLLVLFHLTFEMTEEEVVSSFRNYFNAFGFDKLALLVQLINAGLLPPAILTSMSSAAASSSSVLLQQQKLKSKILSNLPKLQTTFQANANKLKQIPAEEASKSTTATAADQRGQPNCPSYVFNRNYVPLVAQLANFLCTSQSLEELNGRVGHLESLKISSKLDAEKMHLMPLAALSELIKAKKIPELLPIGKPKTVMLFVLGGITYSEVAACHLVERLTGCKIVVASNCITTGYDLLDVL